MNNDRLTLTNRPGNLKLLLDFVQKWARDHSLPPTKLTSLTAAAGEIFQHLVQHAYAPGEPGSIAVELELQGPRLRLMFEDDALPNFMIKGQDDSGLAESGKEAPHLTGLQHLAESLIYYRTVDRKNRLVVFLN
jgi:anti-sigma regulatory factor (Ser/Thr protein kinase)